MTCHGKRNGSVAVLSENVMAAVADGSVYATEAVRSSSKSPAGKEMYTVVAAGGIGTFSIATLTPVQVATEIALYAGLWAITSCKDVETYMGSGASNSDEQFVTYLVTFTSRLVALDDRG